MLIAFLLLAQVQAADLCDAEDVLVSSIEGVLVVCENPDGERYEVPWPAEEEEA